MKKVQIERFVCEVCGESYGNPNDASLCESKPVSEGKGVEVGDIVLVTMGEGKGEKAKVTNAWVVGKDWGHYAWERYWHTVAIEADLIDNFGSRVLTFDSYEPISKSGTF